MIRSHTLLRNPLFLLAGLLLPALLLGTAAWAQDEAPKKKEEKPKIPAPEELTLDTRDGLQLKMTYYGGTKGKRTVPVLILHEFKGNRTEFRQLALALQQLGHAVLVPDLRGHGDSVNLRTPAGPTSRQIDAAKMTRGDFEAILLQDLPAIRGFLLRKNREGELNLNAWTLVGVGPMGSTLAMNWAAVDWSYPPLVTGKQGQDVKAVVLVSPEQNFKGLTMQRALSHPLVRKDISKLIIVGREQSSSKSQADRLHSTLERYHVSLKDLTPEQKAEKQDLFLASMGTSLQGANLLNDSTIKAGAYIAQFIQLRVVNKNFPWDER